jgi:hypothetical protein
MHELDPTMRALLATERAARLAADFARPRPGHIRRSAGLRLVALGLRLAGPTAQSPELPATEPLLWRPSL